jgi:hypothetical protein
MTDRRKYADLDRFDSAAISAILDWQLRGAEVNAVDRNISDVLSFCITQTEELLRKRLDVRLAYDGRSEPFCLLGFPIVVVILDMRYMLLHKMVAACRHGLTITRQRDVQYEITRSAALRLISHFALIGGNVSIALLAKLKAMACNAGPFVPEMPGLYGDVEAGPIDASYLFRWLFAMLHEVGHSLKFADEAQLSDEFLMRQVSEVVNEAGLSHGLRHRLLVKGDGSDLLLSPQLCHLRGEILSDVFAFNFLLQISSHLSRSRLADVNAINIARGAAMYSDTLQFIGDCHFVAQNLRNPERSAVDNMSDFVSNLVRLKLFNKYVFKSTFSLVRDNIFLFRPSGNDPIVEQNPNDEAYCYTKEVFADLPVNDPEMVNAFSVGFEEALQAIGNSDEIEISINNELQLLSRRKLDALEQVEAHSFCLFADSRGVKDRRIEKLRSFC